MIRFVKFLKLLFIIGFLTFSCNHKEKEKLFFEQDLGLLHNQKAIVYFHTGECSFCYGVLRMLNQSFPSTLVVSVSLFVTIKGTEKYDWDFSDFNAENVLRSSQGK